MSTRRPQALLIDLDGVVYRGEQSIRGAAEAVAWLEAEQIPYLFVTNTTSRGREALVDKLAAMGIDVPPDRILAPPDVAAEWLARRHAQRLLLAVPEPTVRAFAGFEVLTLDDQIDAQQRNGEARGVDAVVVGDLGSEWTFARLNAAFRCLMRAPQPLLIALGMTRYWHAADGLRLDTAPFAVALAHASGVDPIVLGKPSPEFYAAGLEKLGVEAGAAAMIGDDIRIDVAGAQTVGLRGILVRTGKFRTADLELGIEPDLVLASIAELPEAWPKLIPS